MAPSIGWMVYGAQHVPSDAKFFKFFFHFVEGIMAELGSVT